MTRVRLAIVLCVATLAATPAAQTPGPPPPPAQPKTRQPAPPLPPDAPLPPGAPRAERVPPGEPVNIRLDVTIIDEGGPAPSRKTVSLTVANGQSGQVRSEVFVQDVGRVPLGVDVLPMLVRDKVHTRITLDYQPNPGQDRKQPTPMSMRLSFAVHLENGKKIVAAQAADPVTDRRVSVEVTATIVK